MKRIYAIPEWCVNCRRCEVACKAQHSPWPGNIVKAFTLAGDEIYNRVRVEGDNIVSFAANWPPLRQAKVRGRLHLGLPCSATLKLVWSRATRRVAWAAARA